MICPLCRRRSASGAVACEACGVDFMKWLHLQGGKASVRRKPRRKEWAPALALGALAALALVVWRTRAPVVPAPSTPAAASMRAPAAVDPLSDIHARSLDEGRLYGVELMRGELEASFERGRRSVSDEGLAAVAARVGLGPPQESPLRDDEAALMAKCRKGGVWAYGSLPPRPEAGVECWAAGEGYPRRWVRQHWSPKRGLWSAYAEPDAARAARFVLATNFSEEREQDARAEASRALTQPGADRHLALLRYYGFLAEREGALAALRGL
ncbi:hypothetical protein EPO15_12185 [bacterium]|nr:MAG: hypothetical protein EPO15_12185 [bacterium]